MHKAVAPWKEVMKGREGVGGKQQTNTNPTLVDRAKHRRIARVLSVLACLGWRWEQPKCSARSRKER